MFHIYLCYQQLICKNEGVSRVTKILGFSAIEVEVSLTQERNGVDLWVGL